MADNNPPDLAHGNQGFTVDGTLIQNGLVISLEKYANDIRENLPSFATNLSVVSPIVDSASKLKKMCNLQLKYVEEKCVSLVVPD